MKSAKAYSVLIIVTLLQYSTLLLSQSLIIPTGHKQGINCIDISPDGKYLITGSNDHYAILWDFASGKEMRDFFLDGREILRVFFIPNSKNILTVSNEHREYGSVEGYNQYDVWNMESGEKLFTYNVNSRDIPAFSPDGSETAFISINGDSSLSLYNTSTGKLTQNYYDSSRISKAVFTTNGNILTAGKELKDWDKLEWNYFLKEWKTNKGANAEPLHKKYLPMGDPYCLVHSADFKTYASSTDDYKVRVWNASSWSLISTITSDEPAYKIDLSPDGKQVCIVYTRNMLKTMNVYDAKTAALMYTLSKPDGEEKPTTSVFSLDGRFIITNGKGRSMCVWNAKTGDFIRRIEGTSINPRGAFFSEDEKFIVNYTADGTRAWQLSNGAFFPEQPKNASLNMDESKRTNDKSLVLVDKEGYLIVLNIVTKKGMIIYYLGKEDWFISDGEGNYDFSPGALPMLYKVNGMQILTDPTLITNSPKYKKGLFSSIINNVKSSATTEKPLTVERECCGIRFEPVRTNDPSPSLQATISKRSGDFNKVAVLFNGHTIEDDARKLAMRNLDRSSPSDSFSIEIPIAAYSGLIQWDTVNTFQLNVFQDDDKTIAYKTEMSFVPKRTDKPDLVLPTGHSKAITQMIMSQDHKYFYTASTDMLVKMWEVSTGREVKTFLTNKGGIRSIALSADGQYLLIKCDGSTDIVNGTRVRPFNMVNVFTDQPFPYDFPIDGNTEITKNGQVIYNLLERKAMNIHTGALYKLSHSQSQYPLKMDVSKDDKYALILNGDQYSGSIHEYKIELYNLVTNASIRSISLTTNVYKDAFFTDEANDFVAIENEIYNTGSPSTCELSLYSFNANKPYKKANFRVDQSKGEVISDAAFSNEKDQAVVVTNYGSTTIWNLASGNCTTVLKQDNFSETLPYNESASGLFLAYYSRQPGYVAPACAFLAGNGKWVCIGAFDGSSGIYQVNNGQKLQSFISHALKIDDQTISSANISFTVKREKKPVAKLFNFIPGEYLKVLQHDTSIAQMTYSPNGKLLLTVDTKGTAKIWLAETGEWLRTYQHPSVSILLAAFTGDGKMIVLVGKGIDNHPYTTYIDLLSSQETKLSEDEWFKKYMGSYENHYLRLGGNERYEDNSVWNGSLKIMNTQTQRAKAWFVALDSADWVAYTSEGYYMSSKNGAKKLYFRKGVKLFDFQQFDLQYNRPDKVLETLGVFTQDMISAYQKAYEKRISRMGFSPENFEEERVFNAPAVNVKNDVPSTTTEKIINISLQVIDSLYNVSRINLYINGVPVYGRKGLDVSTDNEKEINKNLKLELTTGDNLVEISALNAKGVESTTERYKVKYTGPSTKPDLYIIAIGASKYQDDTMNLVYPSKDASDIIALYQTSQQYNNVHSFLLTDKQVTKEAVMNLKLSLEKANVDDEVIVFYAGHGVLDTDLDYYLAMNDMNFTMPNKRGLLYDDFESLLDNIPARKKMVMIDACNAGEIDKDESRLVVNDNVEKGEVTFRAAGNKQLQDKYQGLQNSFKIMNQSFTDLRRLSGATAISSSQGGEYALESKEWNNSVFTYSFLSGIKQMKADLNGDGKVMISELLTYVQKEVEQLTKGKQTPTFRIENLDNDFQVW